MPENQTNQQPTLGELLVAEYKSQMSELTHVLMVAQTNFKIAVERITAQDKELGEVQRELGAARVQLAELGAENAILKESAGEGSAETIKIEATPGELVDVKPARQKPSAG